MKTKSLLITLALAASCFAETKPESNPEIAKIDARLAELQGFYNEENGIINRLTNFKRKPIQKGTRAYSEFLVADQRMRQIAVEAKELKEKKSAILSGGSAPEAVNTTSQKNESTSVGGTTRAGTIEDSIAKMRQAWDESVAKKKNEDSPEIFASRLFTQYDPRNFLHPTESVSPTLKFLQATIEIKSENFKKICEWIDAKNWLALVNHYSKKNLDALPDTKKIEAAAEKMASDTFFIWLFVNFGGFSFKEWRGRVYQDRTGHGCVA